MKKKKQLPVKHINQKKYQVEQISNGSFGTVFKAINCETKELWAIKQLKKGSNQQQWESESMALGSMNHPNIIKFIKKQVEVHEDKNSYYIFMEYFPSQTLASIIRKRKTMPEKQVYEIFKQLLEGFCEMHDHGFMHRDIKPENILINDRMEIKIVDLGQAKAINNSCQLQRTDTKGTPIYTAPEFYHGKKNNDPKRDVWSLGLVLYEMLTGLKCMESNTQKQLKEELLRPIKIKIDRKYSIQWRQLLNKMLVLYPEDRIDMAEIKIFLIDHKMHLKVSNSFFKNLPKNLMFKTKAEQFVDELRSFWRKGSFIVHFINAISRGSQIKSYPFVPNQIKYLLISLALAIYLTSINTLMHSISRWNSMTSRSKKQFKQWINVYFYFYNKQHQKYSQILYKMCHQQINKMQPNQFIGNALLQKIQEKLNTKGTACTQYLQLFQSVQQLPIFQQLQKEENIRKFFYPNDVVVMYLLNVVGMSDEELYGINCNFQQIDRCLQNIRQIKNEHYFSKQMQTKTTFESAQELISKIYS